MKQKLMDKIGFLKWAQLHPVDVTELTGETMPLYLSPDVNSLHLVWQEDGEGIFQEIADYNGYDTIKELIEDEAFDDCQHIDFTNDILEAISDYKDYDEETPPPVVKLKELLP